MANHLQNKSTFDVAANASSFDSLSFAGFLCIQDQKPKSPNSNQIHNEDLDFEFSQAKQESTANDPNKYSPADPLISNGMIMPQTFLLQSKQHPKTNKPHQKGSFPATSVDSKRSRDRTGAKEVSDKQKKELKHSTSKSGFGWKIFKSFASPCRECKAATPTVKTQTIPRESLKLY